MLSLLAPTIVDFSTMPHTPEPTPVNPCMDAPIAAVLVNTACEGANVQSGANVTVGAVGLLHAELDPIPMPLTVTPI